MVLSPDLVSNLRFPEVDLPIQSSEDPNETLRFEVDPSSENPSFEPDATYGLNLRQSTNHNSKSAVPRSYDFIDRLIVKKLREDLDKFPEDGGFEEFDDVPVEGFWTSSAQLHVQDLLLLHQPLQLNF